MADRDSIKKEYQDKIYKLEKHNELYYSKDKPLISDKEYDDLKFSILKLEKKYKFLNDKSSPSKKVGFKPSKNFQKQKHKVPMLSLSNIFDKYVGESEGKISRALAIAEAISPCVLWVDEIEKLLAGSGGDGSLAYNSGTGTITYTGPSASDVRAHFSGGTGITLSGGTFSTTDSEIVHDNLSGFVANEHIDHSGVSIVAGSGLTGGGSITTSRTLNIGIIAR